MKTIDKNTYTEWDSPFIFCRYQTDDEKLGLICSVKWMNEIEKNLDEDISDEELEKAYTRCKCPYTESNISESKGVKICSIKRKKCPDFEYKKNKKNKNAKRYKQSK